MFSEPIIEMETPLFVAFVSLLVLFAVVIYLIRETVPPTRTLNVVKSKEQQGNSPYMAWDSAFAPITPILLSAPERKMDISGNILI